MPTEVREAVDGSVNQPIAQRIDTISKAMLGKPYTPDPLGEGMGTDTDPLVRYDTFDCLTYVEEVLALSLSADPTSAGPIRVGLRYEQHPTYTGRHHFMELQWIPHALRDGWLRDTTSEYGTVEVMKKQVTPELWDTWAGRRRFPIDDDKLPTGAMRLEVLDLDQAVEAASTIRPGTVVLTVRADRSWKPLWISHVGIVVPGDRPTVRHATKIGAGSTRDHGLVWYLNHLRTYKNWPAVGVALLEPVPFGPRLSRLSEEERAGWRNRTLRSTSSSPSEPTF